MRAAFQGIPGAFSHEACLAALPGHEPVPYDTFEAAIRAVEEGACEVAILPAENTTAGKVPQVAELIDLAGLKPVGDHWHPVRLQLMAVPGATLQTLRTAESHPMALAQCRRALGELGLELRIGFDTAGSAREVAAAGDVTRAAVAARPAAGLYGLEVLRENIEDFEDNRTRFLILAPG